jgi:hypothetical protein
VDIPFVVVEVESDVLVPLTLGRVVKRHHIRVASHQEVVKHQERIQRSIVVSDPLLLEKSIFILRFVSFGHRKAHFNALLMAQTQIKSVFEDMLLDLGYLCDKNVIETNREVRETT